MNKLRQTWISDLPMETYHWEEPYSDCLNKSKLTLFDRSPAHCKAVVKSDPTKAQRIGILLHAMALEEKYNPGDFKPDEIELASKMTESLRQHKIANNLVAKGHKEQSGFFKDPDFGFWCKIRVDLMFPDLGILTDIKSTQDAHPNRFKRDIFWFKYDWQGFLYLRGANVLAAKSKKFSGDFHTFLLIAVEKTEPYGVMVYKLSKATLDAAEQQIMPLLERYKNCLETDSWPAYPADILEV